MLGLVIELQLLNWIFRKVNQNKNGKVLEIEFGKLKKCIQSI